jgi:hypothetical protein
MLGLHVLRQIGISGKSLAAGFTREGVNASVKECVVLEFASPIEALIA